jgi:signal transduction histidine kinase
VAGIAHELNTPLGAIRASVGNMAAAAREETTAMPRVLRNASVDDQHRFEKLVARVREADVGLLTSREERKQRRALTRALEEVEVAEPGRVAELLVQIGVTELNDHLELIRSPSSADLLEAAYNISAMERSAATIRVAADRAAKIVFALKTYAHPGGEDGEATRAELSNNVDTVLTLYHNQIKHDVDVERDYADDTAVLARHDELNQVWTNLIHNALQAMDYKGAISIAITQTDVDVSVMVTDSGKGIPAEVEAQIFDPFFTTKAAGEGTGLGLSICRDIVHSHGGTIGVRSKPGETTFTVTVPREPRGDS